ncbi:MAG: hypothetical protein LBS91_08975 [Clostridiales Family XIII bacterium]|nr:hypothetical protein [Clostridiales Family XIII bacterium]
MFHFHTLCDQKILMLFAAAVLLTGAFFISPPAAFAADDAYAGAEYDTRTLTLGCGAACPREKCRGGQGDVAGGRRMPALGVWHGRKCGAGVRD